MKKIILFLIFLLISCSSFSQGLLLTNNFYKVNDGLESIPINYNTEIIENDTINYYSIDICEGDSILLIIDLPDSCSNIPVTFIWDFGDGCKDTVIGSNINTHRYEFVSGYNLFLRASCGDSVWSNEEEIRVRIAKNPIKTIQPLPDICSGSELGVNVGFGANSFIIIDSLSFEQNAKERYENTVFIPDGPNCHHVSSSGCYDAPVTFDQFPPGSTVQSVDDIMSICINMEHSYLGDLRLEIFCPNGQSVMLKDFYDGGNTMLGGAIDEPYNSSCCDTGCAPMGIGWTYCFSDQYLNSPQGLIENAWGNPADSTNTVDTSGYYQTPNSFSSLVGCPLNGEWMLRICDTMSIDNGFVFWWDLELSQTSSVSWDYQVSIDEVVYSGVNFINHIDSVSCSLTPSYNEFGIYNIDINIIDDFGCQWDTNTTVEIIQTPVFDLGEDKNLCEGETIELKVPIVADKYVWEPNGEITQSINVTAPVNVNQINYVALVTNSNSNIECYYQDTITIFINPSITASFLPDKFPLEGCEPYTFKLYNTSTNAMTYEWLVGGEVTIEENPTFVFSNGVYDVKLKVTSAEGCKDSISYSEMINVFKIPIADFGCDPVNPYASNPIVSLVNLTEPKDINNQYHWTIQTNKNDINSIENVFGENPSYTWYPQAEQTVAGDYVIFLDAYSVNNAPSGYVYECHDTISKIITIINDNLMFPNVITPNNDGVNDVFIIHNLIDGQAFPDNELSIYNRYGKRIYFIQDLRDESEFWDPNETNTPTGTYFYRFIGRGPVRNVEYNGSIEVLR